VKSSNKPVKPKPSVKTQKAKKPFKPAKPTKPNTPVKFESNKNRSRHALGDIKKTQTNFLRIRQLLPEFNEMLRTANPFDINDHSWITFFSEAAPKVVAALLWDLGQIERPDVIKLVRFFKQRGVRR